MKKIIILFALLATVVFAENTEGERKSLTNEEIDRVFIGFEEEETERVKKEQEEEIKKKEEEEKIVTRGNGRSVLPYDAGLSVGEGQNTNLMPPPLGQLVDGENGSNPMRISGVLCRHNICKVVTDAGVFKEGAELPSGEKIKKITASSIVTNTRTIKF